MDSRLSQYSTKPSSYRSYLAQQGQATLDALESQKPQVNEANIQQPTAAPSAQLTAQPPQANDPLAFLKSYFGAQTLAPTGSNTAMVGPQPKNALSALGDLGDQSFNEYCQKFVEQNTLGHSGVYPSAIAAWNAQQNKAKPGFDGIQPGDLVYFGADQSNGNAGHTGIYTGNGQFVSATDNGVKQVPLANWLQSTGQRYLGYIPRAAVSDPKGHGAAGAGGGNPLSALANYVQNGVGHVWQGMQGQPDGTQPGQDETFGHMLGSYMSGFTPEGAGMDVARNALTTALHASGTTAHIGAMLPRMAAPAMGMMGSVASHAPVFSPSEAEITGQVQRQAPAFVKTGLQDVAANFPSVMDTIIKHDSQPWGTALGNPGSQIDLSLPNEMLGHWKMLYGGTAKPPLNPDDVANDVRYGMKQAFPLTRSKK